MRSGWRPRIPHNCWRLRYFSLGAIPPRRRSATIAPELGRAERGRKRLNFSGPTQAWAARIGSLAIATSKETAGHRTSSGQTMPDEGQGVRATARETQTVSLRRQRRKRQSGGLIVEGFWSLAREI